MRGQTQIMHSMLIPLSALSIVVLPPIFASHSIKSSQATKKERQNIPERMFTCVWPSVWSGLGSLLSWVLLRRLLLAVFTGLDIAIERGGY
jgi:hypothetical protein